MSNYWKSNITLASGSSSTLRYDSNVGGIVVNKQVEYIEFLFQLLGIDLTYDQFTKMSQLEMKTFIRDYKLEKLLKNNEE